MNPLFSELLAAASILAGAFLAGRYFGLLEAKVKNGRSDDIIRLCGEIEKLLDSLARQHDRSTRKN
jgi:hypothetical protein